MTTTRSTQNTARSRRRFLKVAVMGSAAVVASSVLTGTANVAAAVAKRAPRPRPAAPARSAGVEAEVAKQKRSTSDLLKTIRNFELPAGSEMAFAFVPMKAPKRGAGGGAR